MTLLLGVSPQWGGAFNAQHHVSGGGLLWTSAFVGCFDVFLPKPPGSLKAMKPNLQERKPTLEGDDPPTDSKPEPSKPVSEPDLLI